MANDPYWNNVVLAMHMDDAALTDLKGHSVTLSGNVTLSSTQSKYGGYSAYFDGSGDFLTVPNAAEFQIGTAAVTIDAWIHPTNSAIESAIYAKWTTAANSNEGVLLGVRPNGVLFVLLSTNGQYQAGYDFQSTTGSVPYNTWSHVEFCRTGSTVLLFVNGSIVKTGVFVTSAVFASTMAESIGGTPNGGAPFAGYIDDLRVTAGVARHTTGFSPPVAAFPDHGFRVSGIVKDINGNFIDRPVHVHRQSDGALAGVTSSHPITGAFTVDALDVSPHYATCIYSNTEPAISIHNIIPIL